MDVGFLDVVARGRRMLLEGEVGKDRRHVRSLVGAVWEADAGGHGGWRGSTYSNAASVPKNVGATSSTREISMLTL